MTGHGRGGAKPKAGNAVTVYTPPGVEGALAQMPSELSREASEVWQILVPDLVEQQLFRPSDVLMVMELSELLAEARRFRRRLQQLQERIEKLELMDTAERLSEYGELSAAFDAEDKLDGMLKRARTGWLQCLQRAQSLAGEFGISPVARIRLGLLRVQGASLLEALQAMEGGDDEENIVDGEVISDGG